VIVDTSALIAIAWGENGSEPLEEALAKTAAVIPAPVVVEFALVTSGSANHPNPHAQQLLDRLVARGIGIAPFVPEDAALAVEAHCRHGRGNGHGGKLNMLDVMVYCMAKRLDMPILCTGRDFASTDAQIHPASRTN